MLKSWSKTSWARRLTKRDFSALALSFPQESNLPLGNRESHMSVLPCLATSREEGQQNPHPGHVGIQDQEETVLPVLLELREVRVYR